MERSLGQIAYEATKSPMDREPWGLLPGWARVHYERAAQAVADAVRPELFVVCHAGMNPVVPFDCNPEFEEDEGMLVYRSREAAEASARHQESLYGVEGANARPLHEVLAALAICHEPLASGDHQ